MSSTKKINATCFYHVLCRGRRNVLSKRQSPTCSHKQETTQHIFTNVKTSVINCDVIPYKEHHFTIFVRLLQNSYVSVF